MKKISINKISLLVLICIPLVFIACSDDDKNTFVKGDTSVLKEKLAVCYDSLTVAKPENFTQTSIDEFKTKLDLISSLIEQDNLSEQEVINMNVHLNQSAQTFENSRMYGISEDYLLAGLSFSEGSGTSLIANGKNQLVVNLKSGPVGVFGSSAGYPEFINEGVDGKAIYLNNGAYLEISNYNPNEFLGKQLTIAVWVKPDVIKSGNYIASLNDWNNWKFQLQDQAKAFFTVSTTSGATDSDNERDLTAPTNTWTHLVVVLDLGNATPLSFYTNGVLTKVWTTTQKPGLVGSQATLANSVPLLIGAGVVYDESWGVISPSSWNYFQGALDEVHFYNTAVTAGQVRWLYNKEAALLE